MNRWTVTVTPMRSIDCNGQQGLFKITAVRNDRQAIIIVEKLTEDQVEHFDPDKAWRTGLQADHRHARAISERNPQFDSTHKSS